MFASLPGRLGAAAVRRQPAHHRRPRRSRPAAVLHAVARRGGHGPDRRQHDQPVGQRPHRRPDADRADQRDGRRTSRSWGTSRSGPARARPSTSATSATVEDATDIPTGYALVNGQRAVYILVTKRADASTLDGRQRRQGEPAEDAGACCPTTSRSASSSTSRRTSPTPMQGVAIEGVARGGPDRADGAAVPARLAERHRRRAEHPARPAAAPSSPCG